MTARRRALLPLLRQFAPWLIGIAILVVIATRVPLASFRDAVTQGPHLALAAVDLLVVVITLCTDSIATWLTLRTLRMRRPLSQVAAVRGATSVLFLVNYAVGQGGFGYYLHRNGVSALRAAGATLFLIGTNVAALLLVTTAAWAVHGAGEDTKLWWTLLGGCLALLGYLGVIAARPRVLVARELLAPLFDAGLRGHTLMILARVPHVLVMSLGVWLAMRAWGTEVPLVIGLTIMPMIVFASAVPIAPAGLGTTQAALVYFCAAYATGATADDRAGNVLAFAIVHFVYGTLAMVLVGVACIPFAKRSGALPTKERSS